MSKASKGSGHVVGTPQGGFARALHAASAKAIEQQQRDIRDKLIKLHHDTYGTASAYDNAVILAGYVAFFALWTGVNADVSPLCRLVTVALMGTTLMLYIAWHIIQMLTRQKYEFKCAGIAEFANDPARFNEQWVKAMQEFELTSIRVLRLWPWIFVPSVVLGFIAGGILSYNALAVILGWPELRN